MKKNTSDSNNGGRWPSEWCCDYFFFTYSLWLWSLLLYSLSEVCNFLLNTIFFRLSFQVTSFRRFFNIFSGQPQFFSSLSPSHKVFLNQWERPNLSAAHKPTQPRPVRCHLQFVLTKADRVSQVRALRLKCWGMNESRGGFNHYIALLALSWSWLSERISDEFAAEVTSGEVLCHVDRAQCEC